MRIHLVAKLTGPGGVLLCRRLQLVQEQSKRVYYKEQLQEFTWVTCDVNMAGLEERIQVGYAADTNGVNSSKGGTPSGSGVLARTGDSGQRKLLGERKIWTNGRSGPNTTYGVLRRPLVVFRVQRRKVDARTGEGEIFYRTIPGALMGSG